MPQRKPNSHHDGRRWGDISACRDSSIAATDGRAHPHVGTEVIMRADGHLVTMRMDTKYGEEMSSLAPECRPVDGGFMPLATLVGVL